jgi:hypothetical protein
LFDWKYAHFNYQDCIRKHNIGISLKSKIKWQSYWKWNFCNLFSQNSSNRHWQRIWMWRISRFLPVWWGMIIILFLNQILAYKRQLGTWLKYLLFGYLIKSQINLSWLNAFGTFDFRSSVTICLVKCLLVIF